jgi:rod shape-determining protein MreC
MFLEAHAIPSADMDRSEDVLLLHDQAEPAGPPAAIGVRGAAGRSRACARIERAAGA